MSEASASVGPETRPQPKGGYPPAWHRFCQIRDCGSMGHRILSPDGLWIWSSQRQQWLDVDSVLGYFTSYEIAAAALAGCHTPPPGTAEAERRRFALGQRAWLVNAGDRIRRVADGLVDFATDPAGISEALASELADRKIDESPIHHAITQATRIVDVCGKILSAARAAAGAAIESHTVTPTDLGVDVHGVGIPVVDREPSSHGGTEGTPSGRTDAPAPVFAVTEEQLARWNARLWSIADELPRGEYFKGRVREVAREIDSTRAKMEAARLAGGAQ